MKCMIGDLKKVAYTQSPSFLVRFGLHSRLKNIQYFRVSLKNQYFTALKPEPIFSQHPTVLLQASPQHDHEMPDSAIE